MCDNQLQKQLEEEQAALQNEIKSQQSAKVVLIQNPSFVSQYSYQEKVDIIMSWFVQNIFIIIVLFLALVFVFLVRHLARKHSSVSKITR